MTKYSVAMQVNIKYFLLYLLMQLKCGLCPCKFSKHLRFKCIFQVPDYKQDPSNDKEKDVKTRYAKILGSAVNPVLREGNSDRRCARPVKEMAKKQTKRSPGMKPWSKENVSHVAHMTRGDFYGSEQSHVMANADNVKIVFR